MKRWAPVVSATIAGVLGFALQWTGVIIVCALMALQLAWVLGRSYEAKLIEKRMMRSSLEAFSDMAENLLTEAAEADDLDEDELEALERLKRDYQHAQQLLAKLR